MRIPHKRNWSKVKIEEYNATGKDAYDIEKNRVYLKPGMNSKEPGRVKSIDGKPYVLRQTPKSRAKKAG